MVNMAAVQGQLSVGLWKAYSREKSDSVNGDTLTVFVCSAKKLYSKRVVKTDTQMMIYSRVVRRSV